MAYCSSMWSQCCCYGLQSWLSSCAGHKWLINSTHILSPSQNLLFSCKRNACEVRPHLSRNAAATRGGGGGGFTGKWGGEKEVGRAPILLGVVNHRSQHLRLSIFAMAKSVADSSAGNFQDALLLNDASGTMEMEPTRSCVVDGDGHTHDDDDEEAGFRLTQEAYCRLLGAEQAVAEPSGMVVQDVVEALRMKTSFTGSKEVRSNKNITHDALEKSAEEGENSTSRGKCKEHEIKDQEGLVDVNRTNKLPEGYAAEEMEYYEPKVGDEVIGVVVSGTDKRIDVDIGAEMLGYMLAKDILPFDPDHMQELMWEIPEVSSEEKPNMDQPLFKTRIVRDEDILDMENPRGSLLDVGTVISAEVLGNTLSGRPLLSTRKVTRRIAWERVRQIEEEKEPVEVLIREWNTGGLCAKIEGLRAFLPKEQCLKYPEGGILELKEQVGKRVCVCVIATDESTNKLILSERNAWACRFLHPGCVFEGTVSRLYSFGAIVNVDGTGISGLLHISNISKLHVPQVSDVFNVGEKIKAIVIPSHPEKLSFSTAELESEQGLLLRHKERVFREAEEVGKMIRKTHNLESPPFYPNLQDGASPYADKDGRAVANLEWLEFLSEPSSTATIPTQG